ncbi:hypothetical protein [Thalassobacillus pellis]|uniref:hypothetical protein n=1 Tax=Thalassobacillus pellis TaxID=748008 RepID=UPI00195F587F|nr:hypothetical protein [Thalassobacillus pellis]MBM7553738.1 hypothetical protein [Thalassobacillus pellis]
MRQVLLALLLLLMVGLGVIGFSFSESDGKIKIVDENGSENLTIQTIMPDVK